MSTTLFPTRASEEARLTAVVDLPSEAEALVTRRAGVRGLECESSATTVARSDRKASRVDGYSVSGGRATWSA
jgi:GMP synthase-like glutamine amidotransferase